MIEFKDDGSLVTSDKITKFSNGPIQTKFVCQCKKKYIIEKVVQYNVFVEDTTTEKNKF